MQRLSELLDAGDVALDVEATDVPDLLDQLSRHLVEHGELPEPQGAILTRALLAREDIGSTSIGMGVAVPHAYGVDVPGSILLIARLATPIAYGSPPDGRPVDLVFMLTGPEDAKRTHVKVLARIVRLLHDDAWVAALRSADTPEHVLETVRAVEARHA